MLRLPGDIVASALGGGAPPKRGRRGRSPPRQRPPVSTVTIPNSAWQHMPAAVVHVIALQLDHESVLHLCQTHPVFDTAVCNNEDYWLARYVQDFVDPPPWIRLKFADADKEVHRRYAKRQREIRNALGERVRAGTLTWKQAYAQTWEKMRNQENDLWKRLRGQSGPGPTMTEPAVIPTADVDPRFTPDGDRPWVWYPYDDSNRDEFLANYAFEGVSSEELRQPNFLQHHQLPHLYLSDGLDAFRLWPKRAVRAIAEGEESWRYTRLGRQLLMLATMTSFHDLEKLTDDDLSAFLQRDTPLVIERDGDTFVIGSQAAMRVRDEQSQPVGREDWQTALEDELQHRGAAQMDTE